MVNKDFLANFLTAEQASPANLQITAPARQTQTSSSPSSAPPLPRSQSLKIQVISLIRRTPNVCRGQQQGERLCWREGAACGQSRRAGGRAGGGGGCPSQLPLYTFGVNPAGGWLRPWHHPRPSRLEKQLLGRMTWAKA